MAVGRLLVVAIPVLLLFGCHSEEQLDVRIDEHAGTIVIPGASERDVATLAIHSGDTNDPPMLGRSEVTRDGIVFHPRYPLVRGLPYRVRVAATETIVTLPKLATAATTFVANVFPSASELPANQLKFYLYFSKPMSTGDAYSHIRLVDAEGNDVQRAFLQTSHELWDSSRRRFTLILDPGRIKRGLRANLESGAPLREGHRYSLVIGESWRDGDGNPLHASFEKKFRVIDADRTLPDPHAWRITPPAASTLDPLRIALDEALDRALLEEMVILLDEREQPIAGSIEVVNGETEWRFRPRQPWSEAAYVVRVNPRIEDRAGNNLHRLFDEDANGSAPKEAAEIELPFRVAALQPATR